MCDRTQGSDPTHPQIWHNCQTNEEQIENPENLKYFSKKWCLNQKIASKANNSVK